jgi:hypothetical protein
VKAENIVQPVNTSEILDQEEKNTYNNINKLIKDIKFGPLVSMYEKQDATFEKTVNDYRMKEWKNDISGKQQAFSLILKYIRDKLASNTLS